MKKTLRGTAPNLTKGSSVGRAAMPSRPRDSRTRSSAARAAAAVRLAARPARTGGASGATGGATVSPAPVGRRSAASSRCAISARLASAFDAGGRGAGGVGAATGGGARWRRRCNGTLGRAQRRRRLRRLGGARRTRDRSGCASAAAGAAASDRAAARARSGVKPASGSLRRLARSAAAGPAQLVGERRARRTRRQLGLGKIESVGAGGLALVPGRVREAVRRAAARPRGRPRAGSTSDRARAWRGRCSARRRCRWGRRSSADARYCRGGPAPAGGGRRRRQRRSPPARHAPAVGVGAEAVSSEAAHAASAVTPISASTTTNAKTNVMTCILESPAIVAFLSFRHQRARIDSCGFAQSESRPRFCLIS